jgi:uncharacterized membrane protein
MDVTMVLLRLLHVGLGVFWVGTMIFNAAFLGPSVRDAGPDGAKVMAGIMQRRFMDIMPIVALITVLSGLWLYWKASGGLQPAYVHSAPGITFAVGGVLGIIAYAVGITVVRPSMMNAVRLGPTVAQASPAERDALAARVQAYRARAMGAGKVVAVLLGLAAAAMGVARYL